MIWSMTFNMVQQERETAAAKAKSRCSRRMGGCKLFTKPEKNEKNVVDCNKMTMPNVINREYS